MISDSVPVTELLKRWAAGEKTAEARLFDYVYRELRRVAGHYLRKEGPGHSLQPTALVNEVYLRIAGSDPVDWKDRAHFFALASRAMRRVLVDHARTKLAKKRGAEVQRVTWDGEGAPASSGAEEILAVDTALESLAKIEPRQASIVEMRYFSGLSVEETAAVLGVSSRTVKREWSLARIWLRQEIAGRSLD